ncbi:MAG: gamma-glutamylcyclotransferase [Motiliproteus sp.]|nr:gamma-glutamylcyclotransferase [Motiliproteus sp.]MCW9050739.1 gamma-glutamylcyclotransferase [Motiliproteus sp.]
MSDESSRLQAHANFKPPQLPPGDLWVFAYGSLMWKPGFDYIKALPATLKGYHRSLCVWSHVHRGTPEQPGMVLGLDHGGHCRGRALLVAEADRDAVCEYLYGREVPTLIYQAKIHEIAILGYTQPEPALCFLVDRNHYQYAGRQSPLTCAQHIINSQGISGHSRDYLQSTLSHLQSLGIEDKQLLQIDQALQQLLTTQAP